MAARPFSGQHSLSGVALKPTDPPTPAAISGKCLLSKGRTPRPFPIPAGLSAVLILWRSYACSSSCCELMCAAFLPQTSWKMLLDSSPLLPLALWSLQHLCCVDLNLWGGCTMQMSHGGLSITVSMLCTLSLLIAICLDRKFFC